MEFPTNPLRKWRWARATEARNTSRPFPPLWTPSFRPRRLARHGNAAAVGIVYYACTRVCAISFALCASRPWHTRAMNAAISRIISFQHAFRGLPYGRCHFSPTFAFCRAALSDWRRDLMDVSCLEIVHRPRTKVSERSCDDHGSGERFQVPRLTSGLDSEDGWYESRRHYSSLLHRRPVHATSQSVADSSTLTLHAKSSESSACDSEEKKKGVA